MPHRHVTSWLIGDQRALSTANPSLLQLMWKREWWRISGNTLRQRMPDAADLGKVATSGHHQSLLLSVHAQSPSVRPSIGQEQQLHLDLPWLCGAAMQRRWRWISLAEPRGSPFAGRAFGEVKSCVPSERLLMVVLGWFEVSSIGLESQFH